MTTTKSTYVSESPGKTLARLRLWLSAMKLGIAMRQEWKGALVLAGHGGDLGVLEAVDIMGSTDKGKAHKSILPTVSAVDLDTDCVWLCKGLYPQANVAHADINDACKAVEYNFAHLDFCNGLTAENIQTAANVATNASGAARFIGVTIMKGREHKRRATHIRSLATRAERRRRLRSLRKEQGSLGSQLLCGNAFDPALAISRATEHLRKATGVHGALEKRGRLTNLGHGLARAHAFSANLSSLLLPSKLDAVVVTTFCYHSRSRSSGGTPFVTFLLAIVPRGYTRYTLAQAWANNISVHHAMSVKLSEEALKPTVLECAKRMSTTACARIFNINPKTIAAWRAHATRGTYTYDPKKDSILSFKGCGHEV